MSGAEPAGAASKGTYTFLYSGDFTGATMAYTEAEVLGLKARHEADQRQGRHQGARSSSRPRTTEQPATAGQPAQAEAQLGPDADAVYPGGSSEVTEAMLPILTRSKILSIDATSSATLNNPSRYRY